MRSLKIYIAGPYSADSEEKIMKNVWKAIDAGIKLWKMGHYPYIPHLTHWIDERSKNIGVKMSYEEYRNWDAPWLDFCDAVLHLGNSNGANAEVRRALQTGKPVFKSIREIPKVDRERTWVASSSEEQVPEGSNDNKNDIDISLRPTS